MGRCAMSSFGLPKLGNAAGDWEDAAAHSESLGRFAVSDGAASAFQAQLWSHLLAAGFLELDEMPDEDQTFSSWAGRLAETWRHRTAVAEDAPYYIKHAQERGSFATFLGVTVNSEGRYDAIAVGDTCMFVVRETEMLEAFPVTDADAFGFSPDLVATNDPATVLKHTSGQLEFGDILLGATDATSEWVLRSATVGDVRPILALTAPIDAAEAAVTAAHQAGAIRNDDVAVVRCEWRDEAP